MPATQAIPQCNPHASYVAQKSGIDEAVRRVLDNGRYILGPEVAGFESEFADFLEAPHAIGVASGTDALELALRALGIGEGDAVITVSHTAVATAVAIRSTGAVPIFSDVDPSHGLMDPVHVQHLLAEADKGHTALSKNRIRAIIPVHLYGRCADMEALTLLAREHDLKIIEDCAQAHGARLAGRRAGTFGAFGTFSFYPTKNLGALGDGGALICADAELDQRVRLLREYGWRKRYISEIDGCNSRLDELQAAILRVKLARLETDNIARQRIADLYREQINSPYLILPGADEAMRHVYHQFVVRCRERDNLQQSLQREGIGTLVHYPVPVHLQPAYADPKHTPIPLPNTELWAREVLSLPMFPQLGEDAAMRVASALNNWQPGRA